MQDLPRIPKTNIKGSNFGPGVHIYAQLSQYLFFLSYFFLFYTFPIIFNCFWWSLLHLLEKSIKKGSTILFIFIFSLVWQYGRHLVTWGSETCFWHPRQNIWHFYRKMRQKSKNLKWWSLSKWFCEENKIEIIKIGWNSTNKYRKEKKNLF